jgi:hypothetical protein
MVNSLPFRTADEAAVAALLDILPKSIKEQQEYGGYILRIGSGQQIRFVSTPFPLQRTSKPKGGKLPPLKLPLQPPGAKLVAQIHTHPFDEDWYDEEVGITSIKKPARFSQDIDVPGQKAFEAAWQQISPGPIDMYVIDIHKEVDVLEARTKNGVSIVTERMVRQGSDLTSI